MLIPTNDCESIEVFPPKTTLPTTACDKKIMAETERVKIFEIGEPKSISLGYMRSTL